MLAQASEQHIVVEPLLVRLTKCVVLLAQAALSILQKPLCCVAQQRKSFLAHTDEIDRAVGIGERGQFLPFEVSVISQPLEADHKNVAGEGGSTGVRRVSVACRTEWQN